MKKSPPRPTTGTPLPRPAETRLRARAGQNGNGAGPGRSAADNQQLLHELQVYQIELEMQNEELRKARDEMEAGMDKYSELYDFAPVGYLTLDRDGAISEANLTVASLLAVSRSSLVKQRLVFFLAPPDRPLYHSFLQQVFEGKARKECDVRLLVRGRPAGDVRLRANLFASGRSCRIAVMDITAYKLAEAATAQLAAIVKSSSDAIIGRDLDGNITSWNAGAERLFGYGAGEMIGGSIARLIPADLRREEEEMLRQIRLGKNETHRDTVRVAKDGRQLVMSVTISPIRQADGQITGISKVARDITEQKRAADQVLVSEVRYRRLFEAAKDGILILDPQTRKITEANPFIVQVLGYTREQLIGKELWQIGLLKDEAASQEAFRVLQNKGFIRYEDLPLETRGGQRREVEFVSNLYDEGGEAVIQCNIRDITERKHAEQALLVSEERYRTLFNSMDEGYCIIEMIFTPKGRPVDYRFLEVNPAFEKQTGIRGGLGKRMREIVQKPEPYWFEIYGRVVRTGRPVRYSNEMSGLRRSFDVDAFRLGGPGSRKVAVLFTDITRRKRSDQALLAARAQLTAHAGQLEKLVTQRTVQLTSTNRQLVAALTSTRLGEEQNRVLLLEEQVMRKKLRQLTHQILTAQEEERKKISRELHDDVVQTLVGINVELSALVYGNSVGVRQLKDKITRTQRLVEKSVDSVHRFARDLRPAVLDDLGLIPALQAFCTGLAERKNLKIRLTAFRGIEAMASDSRTVLFRVAQEALNNVARHARATRVEVTISKIPGAMRLAIGDNGKSFPVKKVLSARNPKRLGLVGMRERVEMIGGNFTIESVSGKGTTVSAEIPFHPGKTKS